MTLMQFISIKHYDYVNKHGESLIGFLRDSKMFLINGRICPLDDHFTSVSIKAVVDDVMEAQNCLENCISCANAKSIS